MKRPRELQVALGERSYAIHAGSGLLADGDFLGRVLGTAPVFLVSDENVAQAYLPALNALLGEPLLGSHIVPAGEASKSLQRLGELHDAFAAAGLPRDGQVLALGGGVVGDLAGFAAATWHRGVDLIQLPTSLLAQVDSAVGGKTAINHASGKNLIGAFHQPRAVIADSDTLATLPEREYRAGLAEVVKHAVIADPHFLHWLEARVRYLLEREPGVLADTVIACCRIKADIVSEDERESGRRAILNFGHTFGHAIETATETGDWLHGEAVAAGMVQALELSRRLGGIDEAYRDRITGLLDALGLPVEAPRMPAERWLELMGRDKKVAGGRMRFVIVDGPGSARLTADVDSAMLEAVLKWSPAA